MLDANVRDSVLLAQAALFRVYGSLRSPPPGMTKAQRISFTPRRPQTRRYVPRPLNSSQPRSRST